jgi:hypothetical protein
VSLYTNFRLNTSVEFDSLELSKEPYSINDEGDEAESCHTSGKRRACCHVAERHDNSDKSSDNWSEVTENNERRLMTWSATIHFIC